MTAPAESPAAFAGNKKLFWACFIALVATSFGFIVRALIITDWGAEFGLSETEKGQILGVGLWPFAISIVLFSLVIDRIGYGKAMVFAFACHVVSAIVTIFATSYEMLYWGTFIVALGNGTVEAVINPVVATMFKEQKTKWLNILHAGWPGGLVLGGLMALAMGADVSWKWKVALIFIPVLIYGVMLLGSRFPVHERVKAGISYREMLGEAGFLGALIVIALMVFEIGRVFNFERWQEFALIGVLVVGYGAYVRSAGRPMFILLLLFMIPIATTELGTDSWISDLMGPEMVALGLQAGWVIVYTSFIMMVLRFCAGPIVHRLSPLGLLATSAAIAAVGLVALSAATGLWILLAATLFALGKTFFWPTMLGVVAERFPRGGALTLNVIGGVGMLGVGVVGAVLFGAIQDRAIERDLSAYDAEHETTYVENHVILEKKSIFGSYAALDPKSLPPAESEARKEIDAIVGPAKKSSLFTVAIFPAAMIVCFLGLILYFRSRGGYRAVQLEDEDET